MSAQSQATVGAVAVVVQRWHDRIAGGSEHLAYQFARLLSERYPVELLTTTAVDAGSWENALPAGASEQDGFLLRRFRVSRGRDACWFKLHELLVRYHHARQTEPRPADPENFFGQAEEPEAAEHPWTVALQEEWLRRQGPHSEDLIAWLSEHGDRYRAILFVTYLYSPAYFGSAAVDPNRAFLVSTLHDEPPAYLSIFARMARRVRGIFWLTEAERGLARRLWGELPGRVIPAFIASDWMTKEPSLAAEPGATPFLLYSGRIDPGKGVPLLLEYFTRFKKEERRELDLVLIGSQAMKLPRRSDIRNPGFVAEDEKRRLFEAAAVFVMPSPLESLSIVTLEAMAAGTPVLVNGENPVLREHIRKGDGRAFFDYRGFAAELTALLEDAELRRGIAARARTYVREQFSRERVARELYAAIESV